MLKHHSILLLIILIVTNVLCLQTNSTEILQNWLTPNAQISPICRKQLESLDNTTLFLMLDASTKIPNSPASGNLYDFGNFDQCYNIKSNTSYGKYCLGTKPFESKSLYKAKSVIFVHEPQKEGAVGLLTGLHYALCIPDECQPEEFLSDLRFSEEFCYSKNHQPELTFGAVFTIIFLSVIVALTIASTIYEMYLRYTDKKSNKEFLLAFSLITNGSKLFKYSNHSNQLHCLHGIKGLSLMWVMLGHKASILTTVPILNAFTVFEYEENNRNVLVVNSDLAPDSFLFIGGLLAAYSFLSSHNKGVKFNLFKYYLHRFLRISPGFGVAILIHANLLKYLSNGPIWANMDATLGVKCRTEWLYDFLYIHNYAVKGGCLPQTWYLSLDMQLFLLSPLIFLPLVTVEKVGLKLLGTLLLFSAVIPSTIAYIYKLHLLDPLNFIIYYYFPTHTRFGVYIVGIVYGCLLYSIKKNGKKRLHSRRTVISLWIISIGGLLLFSYITNVMIISPYHRLIFSVFLGVHRQLFTACLGLLIYLCVTGYGGFVNDFLSLPIFQLSTKIAYAIYLLHYAVISFRYFTMRTSFYFSNINILTDYWGDFIYTMLVSILFTLLFESPIAVLEKYIFKRDNSKKTIRKAEEPLNGV